MAAQTAAFGLLALRLQPSCDAPSAREIEIQRRDREDGAAGGRTRCSRRRIPSKGHGSHHPSRACILATRSAREASSRQPLVVRSSTSVCYAASQPLLVSSAMKVLATPSW